jgi:hypothetical protein
VISSASNTASVKPTQVRTPAKFNWWQKFATNFFHFPLLAKLHANRRADFQNLPCRSQTTALCINAENNNIV